MARKMFPILATVALVVLHMAGTAAAQDSATVRASAGDRYVISARAGGVNYVEGEALVRRADGRSGRIVKGDELRPGERVSTDAGSRIEILLNPGSFVRLNGGSEFEFIKTSLDDLSLKVFKGSALFEVYASNDFVVRVDTPQAKFLLVKSGVYRVDVLENGAGRIEVWSGRARTTGGNSQPLKKGRTATADLNGVTVSKFSRAHKDDFEKWSKDRAKLIAKANKKFRRRALSNSLLSGFRSDMWDCYSSVGLWVYSRRYSTYSFLPFGFGWRSPYGFGLRTSTGICYAPRFYYYRRPVFLPRGGGKKATPPPRTEPGPNPRTNADRGRRIMTPPFQRMQNTRSVRVSRTARRSGPGFFPSAGSGPTSVGRRSGSSSSSTKSNSSPRRKPVTTKRRN